MRKLLILFTLICTALLFTSLATAQEAKKAEKDAPHYDYIGVNKCKLCHKKDGTYTTWLETKHAKAWESLDEKQQKDEKCVGCHTTGTDAKGVLLTGVQCEACHGPGSAYKSMSIMKDKEKAIANGLHMPNEETCKKCHNENVPEEFRSKEPFNFEKMKAKGVHAMPSAAKEKATEKEG